MLNDLATVASLIVLEGLLSADNALVLAVLVRHLPKTQQKRALKWGLIGAFGFRLICVLLATWLLQMWYLKLGGAIYLLYIGISHIVHPAHDDEAAAVRGRGFWGTVLAVELTDLVFSIDSILAAVALSDKLWVIYLGGIVGIVAMRFVAGGFLRLIDKFPGLTVGAYVLVTWIGVKLLLEGWEDTLRTWGPRWHWSVERIEQLHWHMPSWFFWSGMATILAGSFLWQQRKGKREGKF